VIENAVGGDWIIWQDRARYLVLEQYESLPMSIVDISNGQVLLASDVFPPGGMLWEAQKVDQWVTYVTLHTPP
jgi:hypothetical protein